MWEIRNYLIEDSSLFLMFFCSFNERKQVVGLILLYARHKENLVYKRIFYHWGSYVIIANRNV